MEKVADGHFPTPSIAGQELGKLVHTLSELVGIILLLILWRVGK